MDHHPPKTPVVYAGDPTVQAHVRVPDSVNRSEWLKRKSGGRRRRSVHGSRHAAGGASTDGRGNPKAGRNFSPPPRDRDVSVDSTTSSIASSTSTTISRLSMVSAPPRPTQPRQENNGYKAGAGARRYGDGGGDRGRRRPSFDAGQPRAAAASSAATAAEAIPSSSTSSSTRCAVCQADFTRYRRPHRCRACGKTVCATCSPARTPKRACKRCAGGSAAPRVVATVSPPRQAAVIAPYAPPPTGAARAARKSVGSSARVLVGRAPPKPAAAVAGATYSARVSADGPKKASEGELGLPNRRASVSVSKERAKVSRSSVGGVGGGEGLGGSELLGGVGRVEPEEPISPAGDGREAAKGLDRPDGDRVEAASALGNAGHIEDAVKPFPNGVLSNSSPNRMDRDDAAAAEPDVRVPAASAGAGRDGLSPLLCGASDNAEGQAVCGPEATTADARAAVFSEGGGGGGPALEEAAGACLPVDFSVKLDAPPLADGDRRRRGGVLTPPVGEQRAPGVMPTVVGGERSRRDEVLTPPVGGQSAPEVVAESETEVVAHCATAAASPPPSPPCPPERAQQQSAATDPEELVLEPFPMEPTEQLATAPSSETADQQEMEAAQHEEEGGIFPKIIPSQPTGQPRPSEEDGRVEEVVEEEVVDEAGLAAKSAGGRSADEEATQIEPTSLPAGLHTHHQEDKRQEMGEERKCSVPHEAEDGRVERGVNNEQEDRGGGVLAATAEFCAESPVDEGLLGGDRKTTDMVVTDAPQDKPEEEVQWDDARKEAVVEEIDDRQRKGQGVSRAPADGLLLGSGGFEEIVAEKRGDAGSSAAQRGSEEGEREEETYADAASSIVEGEHAEGAVGLSTADGVSDGEGRVSEMAAEPEEDPGLLVTPLTDDDAERGVGSRADQVESKGAEAGMAAATEDVGPNPEDGAKASGLLEDSEPASRALPSVSSSLDWEETAREREKDTTENVIGGNGLRDQEGGVAEEWIVAPALPRDEETGGGGPQRAVETPAAPSSGVPEGEGDGIDMKPSANVGGDRGREAATKMVVPPPASYCSSPAARAETRHSAAAGADVASPGGGVSAEAGEGAGGFLATLKEIFQKGRSCCR